MKPCTPAHLERRPRVAGASRWISFATVAVSLFIGACSSGGYGSDDPPPDPTTGATSGAPEGSTPATATDGDSADDPLAIDGVVPGFEPNARLVRVVDGDTIIADIDGRDERVRLIGIDTPESVIPDTPPECFGVEASNHLKDLLPIGTDILIERDAEVRDRFDRLLGYVFRSSDGEFVNLRMVADGFALQLTIPPNVTHADLFRNAVALARQADRGLWSACPT